VHPIAFARIRPSALNIPARLTAEPQFSRPIAARRGAFLAFTAGHGTLMSRRDMS